MNHAGAPGGHTARLTDSDSKGIVSKDLPTERERLRLLEQDSDPQTIETLQGLPVDASWRCLDLGAGAGSIAYWLANRCRDGHVVAADIDPTHHPNCVPRYEPLTRRSPSAWPTLGCAHQPDTPTHPSNGSPHPPKNS